MRNFRALRQLCAVTRRRFLSIMIAGDPIKTYKIRLYTYDIPFFLPTWKKQTPQKDGGTHLKIIDLLRSVDVKTNQRRRSSRVQ